MLGGGQRGSNSYNFSVSSSSLGSFFLLTLILFLLLHLLLIWILDPLFSWFCSFSSLAPFTCHEYVTLLLPLFYSPSSPSLSPFSLPLLLLGTEEPPTSQQTANILTASVRHVCCQKQEEGEQEEEGQGEVQQEEEQEGAGTGESRGLEGQEKQEGGEEGGPGEINGQNEEEQRRRISRSCRNNTRPRQSVPNSCCEI